MSIRERARLGAVALGLGAAVLAGIQILEQTVSQFNPRPAVSVLITVLVAAVGVTLARARSVASRGQFLSIAVREWPMATAGDADPLMLGVFPPKETGSDVRPPYVPRRADEALNHAIGQGGFVLVVGPARAGKSRSAYEALRRALPTEKLLVPTGGRLASASGDFGLRSADAVWWLDDLERSIPELDQPVLSWLLSGTRLMVASIRSDSWSSLLNADGETGELGRQLLAGARVIQLPAELNTDERDEAQRIYPHLDMTHGIGVAVAADSDADSVPSPAPVQHARPSRRLDPVLGVALLATAALAAALGAAIISDGFSNSPPPPLAAQLERIIGDGYKAKQHLIYYDLNADLHGLGQHSWILVWRSPTVSDDLQVYDDDNGRLVKRLDFRPSAPGTGKLLLVRHQLLNIDGFFQNSLVALFTSLRIAPSEFPVVITWSDTSDRYILSPLLPRVYGGLPTPRATPPPRPGFTLARLLREPIQLAYWSSGATIAVDGFAVSSFAILPAHGPNPAMLAIARATTHRFYGGTFPVQAVAVYELAPLLSTNDAPRLTCLWPANPFRRGWVIGGAKLMDIDGFVQFPGLDRKELGPINFLGNEKLLTQIARNMQETLFGDNVVPCTAIVSYSTGTPTYQPGPIPRHR